MRTDSGGGIESGKKELTSPADPGYEISKIETAFRKRFNAMPRACEYFLFFGFYGYFFTKSTHGPAR
jgi:hypothetical protein